MVLSPSPSRLMPPGSADQGSARERLVCKARNGKVIVGARRRTNLQPPLSSQERVGQDGAAPSVRGPPQGRRTPQRPRPERLALPGGIPGSPQRGCRTPTPRGRRRAGSDSGCARNPITGSECEYISERRGRARSLSAPRDRPSMEAVLSRDAEAPAQRSGPRGARPCSRDGLVGAGCTLGTPTPCATPRGSGTGGAPGGARPAEARRGRRRGPAGSDHVAHLGHHGLSASQRAAGPGSAGQSRSGGRRTCRQRYDPSTGNVVTDFPASQVAWCQRGSHAHQRDDDRRRDGVRAPIPFRELRQRPVGGKVRSHTSYDEHTREYTEHYPPSQVPWARISGSRAAAGSLQPRGMAPLDRSCHRPALGGWGSAGSPAAGVRSGTAADKAAEVAWDSPTRRRCLRTVQTEAASRIFSGTLRGASMSRPGDYSEASGARFVTSPNRGGGCQGALCGAACVVPPRGSEQRGRPRQPPPAPRRKRRGPSAQGQGGPILPDGCGSSCASQSPARGGTPLRRASPSPSVLVRNCITGLGVQHSARLQPTTQHIYRVAVNSSACRAAPHTLTTAQF
eukprot:TRINITY_DN14701_c0_g1_i1.p1 TRINITY_DN14701_c0_g1~~TRINITY_DN14701_c0_g1_i1.p1  ORF type:complete len:566 (+),score=56.09 TRINITY_DN14701_c0_g1_i1:82-1779(+)